MEKERVLEDNDMNLIDYKYLEENSKFSFIVGHKQIANIENIDNTNYFTVLRDPVDRVVSYYFYLKNFEKVKGERKQLDNFVIDQQMNFDQYLEYTKEKYWDNLIARFFSGKVVPLINPSRMKNFKGKYDKDNLQVNEKDFILARKNLKRLKFLIKIIQNKKVYQNIF